MDIWLCRSSYREAISTQHGALEYGSNLQVNTSEDRTIVLGLLKNKKNAKCRFFIHKICTVIHPLSVEHDGGV